MSQTLIRPAIANMLRNSQKVVSLLGDTALGSANRSIILAGRLTQGFETSVPLPCIAIQDSGNLSNPYALPFFDYRFLIRVVDAMPSSNNISYNRIDAILQECIEAIHRRPITVNASYYTAFRPQYDNYISPDSVDIYINLPTKYARFCVYGAMLRYGESG